MFELVCAVVFGFISVLVFAVLGDGRDWMPHWDHNYLSWAFAIGGIRLITQALSCVHGDLFIIYVNFLH